MRTEQATRLRKRRSEDISARRLSAATRRCHINGCKRFAAFVGRSPATATLDDIRAQIVNLLQDLQDRLGLTYLFIAHDLAMVSHISSRIAVMYLGKIMELAPKEATRTEPLHPYTWALLSAVPSADPVVRDQGDRIRLLGDPPSPIDPPEG